MAKELACVPDDVKLRCGVSTKVVIKTSDNTQNTKITALGYDKTVASIHPTEGTTNNDGYLEVTVTCGQEGVCPGETTVTFDAVGYKPDELDIECESFGTSTADTARVALVDVPLRKLPKLLSKNIGLSCSTETTVTKDKS